MREMEETQSNITRYLESIPTKSYIGLALGSVLVSALLYISGRRSTALFVGQWPPTFAALALIYKLLAPGRERPGEQMREMGEEVRRTARETRSRVTR
jgi:hypothetical protein